MVKKMKLKDLNKHISQKVKEGLGERNVFILQIEDDELSYVPFKYELDTPDELDQALIDPTIDLNKDIIFK